MPLTDDLRALTVCPKCGSKDTAFAPVPGGQLQFWCNACESIWSDQPDEIDLT